MEEVYAAVASSTAVRLFFAIVAVNDYECEQYDVVAAFLNAKIPDGTAVYVQQPHGYEDGTDRVCRLNIALYGLRKSPLRWFQTYRSALTKIGFKSLESEVCIFRHKDLDAYIIIYMDDMRITAKTTSTIRSVAAGIGEAFDLQHLDTTDRFLGFTIRRDRASHRIWLSQDVYAKKIIQKFGYENLKPADTPWPYKFSLPLT